MDKQIHAGHRKRVRKRIDSYGIRSLEHHELLEFLLFYVIPRRNTNPLAHNLINHFGSFKKVLSASYEELREFGLPKRAAFWISHLNDFIEVYFEIVEREANIYSDDSALEWIKKECKDLPPGKLYVAALKNTGFVYHSELFKYDPKSISKNVENVCKTALRAHAYSIVIAQTYDDEHFTPDPSDCEETINYCYGLSVFGVKLIDRYHLSGGKYISYNELGAFCATEDDLEKNAYYRLVSMEEQ